MEEQVVYTADKIILFNGREYSDTDFYFVNGFTFISTEGNVWTNTRQISKIINPRIKEK